MRPLVPEMALPEADFSRHGFSDGGRFMAAEYLTRDCAAYGIGNFRQTMVSSSKTLMVMSCPLYLQLN